MGLKEFSRFTKGKIILTIIQGFLFSTFLFYYRNNLILGKPIPESAQIAEIIAILFNPVPILLDNLPLLGTEIEQIFSIIISPIYWYIISCIIVFIYFKLKR